METPIITLTTDFGLRDPYIAEMKAVILTICPDARIVDLSHEVEKFDVKMGAYILACASRFFPTGTIHVSVVDPEVGTERKSLLVETKKSFFVGPDNGVMTLALDREGVEHVYEISNIRLMLPKTSCTFHGRDIFAPAAAHLANGSNPADFGPELHKMVRLGIGRTISKRNAVVGEILYTDEFGNIITNISQAEIEKLDTDSQIRLIIGNRMRRLRLCKAYDETKKHESLALIGSHGWLEISVNQGNAAKTFCVRAGDKVEVKTLRKSDRNAKGVN